MLDRMIDASPQWLKWCALPFILAIGLPVGIVAAVIEVNRR